VPTTPGPVTSPTPAPSPTPTIIPVPTPSVVPTPDPGTTACVPAPPPLNRINVKVHNDQGLKKVLDSAPIVCSGGEFPRFCENLMNDPNRRCCPPRPEGHPQRFACEEMLMGTARDTGRVGPTWTANDRPCVDGSTAVPRCSNNPSNQYLVFAFGSGRFRACAQNGVCGEVTVP
jgi:hypothetical protein